MNHHHAGQTVFVVSLVIDQLAHVKSDTLVHHQAADQNVLQALNVSNVQHVSIRNAEILAQALAESMQNVKLSTTTRFVVVQSDILAIHSTIAHKNVCIFTSSPFYLLK